MKRLGTIIAGCLFLLTFVRCDDGINGEDFYNKPILTLHYGVYDIELVNQKGENLFDWRKTIEEGSLGQDYFYIEMNGRKIIPTSWRTGRNPYPGIKNPYPEIYDPIYKKMEGCSTYWLVEGEYVIAKFEMDDNTPQNNQLMVIFERLFPSRKYQLDLVFPKANKRIHFNFEHFTHYVEYRDDITLNLTITGDDVVSWTHSHPNIAKGKIRIVMK